MKLDDLLVEWEPRLRTAFLEAVARLRNTVQVNVLTAMITAGDVNGALRAVGINPVAYRPFELAVSGAYEAAGNVELVSLPASMLDDFKVKTQFDVRHPRAENWLRLHSLQLVNDLTEDQKLSVREYLIDGMQKGKSPYTVAIDIAGKLNRATGRREGGVIGLSTPQTRWLMSYEQELDNLSSRALTRSLRDSRFDASLQRHIDTKIPLEASLRSNLLSSYRNRALKYRADTIALTETLTALHEGQREAIEQAIDAGQVKRDEIFKVWRSRRDDRVRDTHAALDGQRRPFDEPFQSPSGELLQFPGDSSASAGERINCRCWIETQRIK